MAFSAFFCFFFFSLGVLDEATHELALGIGHAMPGRSMGFTSTSTKPPNYSNITDDGITSTSLHLPTLSGDRFFSP